MAAGSRLWNSLPAGLRQTVISYEQFEQLLKTYNICFDIDITEHCGYLFKLRLSIFYLLTYL